MIHLTTCKKKKKIIQISYDFLSEILEIRREYNNIKCGRKKKNQHCQTTVLHPTNISIKNEGKERKFQVKENADNIDLHLRIITVNSSD